jgi:hypothetical protein
MYFGLICMLLEKKKQKTYFDIIFTFLLQMMMNMPLSPIGDAPHVSGRNFGDF